MSESTKKNRRTNRKPPSPFHVPSPSSPSVITLFHCSFCDRFVDVLYRLIVSTLASPFSEKEEGEDLEGDHGQWFIPSPPVERREIFLPSIPQIYSLPPVGNPQLLARSSEPKTFPIRRLIRQNKAKWGSKLVGEGEEKGEGTFEDVSTWEWKGGCRHDGSPVGKRAVGQSEGRALGRLEREERSLLSLFTIIDDDSWSEEGFAESEERQLLESFAHTENSSAILLFELAEDIEKIEDRRILIADCRNRDVRTGRIV